MEGVAADSQTATGAGWHEPEALTEIAGFAIRHEIGRGGMGVVYAASQADPDRTVALKVIAPDLSGASDLVDRIRREAQVMASIEHPNVVPIYESGEFEGRPYIAMRLVEGTNLGDLLAKEGSIEPQRSVEILEQVCAVLDAAHSHGIVHRDVKPRNVLLDSRGHVYLGDFGIARYPSGSGSGPTLTEAGHWIGTADYVAPEQAKGDRIDRRADVYSAGCVLHQMLTGTPPYPGSEAEKISSHLTARPPRPSSAGAQLAPFDDVVAKAMAKGQGDRYDSAGALAEAARGAIEVQRPPLRFGFEARRILAVACFLAAAAGSIWLGFTLGDRGGDESASAGPEKAQQGPGR